MAWSRRRCGVVRLRVGRLGGLGLVERFTEKKGSPEQEDHLSKRHGYVQSVCVEMSQASLTNVLLKHLMESKIKTPTRIPRKTCHPSKPPFEALKFSFEAAAAQSSELDEFIYHECLVHPAMLAHANPKRVAGKRGEKIVRSFDFQGCGVCVWCVFESGCVWMCVFVSFLDLETRGRKGLALVLLVGCITIYVGYVLYTMVQCVCELYIFWGSKCCSSNMLKNPIPPEVFIGALALCDFFGGFCWSQKDTTLQHRGCESMIFCYGKSLLFARNQQSRIDTRVIDAVTPSSEGNQLYQAKISSTSTSKEHHHLRFQNYYLDPPRGAFWRLFNT